VTLQRDLREFIGLLNSHCVEYVIVGGHAVAFHGFPRYTGDIDFFVRPTEENGARLMAVLKDFGFAQVALTGADFSQPGRVVQLGLPPNRIDLLTGISGVTFEEAWATRVDASLDGLPTPFLGRAALLENKRRAGRPKDTADLAELDPE
jgi:hypothetical protein